MFFAGVPKTFLDKMLALKAGSGHGQAGSGEVPGFIASHPDNASQFSFSGGYQSTRNLCRLRVLRYPYLQVHRPARQRDPGEVPFRAPGWRAAALQRAAEIHVAGLSQSGADRAHAAQPHQVGHDSDGR